MSDKYEPKFHSPEMLPNCIKIWSDISEREQTGVRTDREAFSWIHMYEGRVQWQPLVIMVMNNAIFNYLGDLASQVIGHVIKCVL
jgi:hypothetical protein